MSDDSTAKKRSDGSPPLGSLDATAAGPEPGAQGRSEDGDFQRMLFLMHQHLGKNPGLAPNAKPTPGTEKPSHGLAAAAIRRAPMLVVGSIPFAVLLSIIENKTRRNVLSEILPFFVGCWAVFALWIILAKGMFGSLEKRATGTAWLLLGLLNLVAALGTLLLLAMR